jgi:hypothetical protein
MYVAAISDPENLGINATVNVDQTASVSAVTPS